MRAGGYFSAAGDDPSILMRAKEDYDGAEPAASSIAAANLFNMGALISGDAGEQCAAVTLHATASAMSLHVYPALYVLVTV